MSIRVVYSSIDHCRKVRSFKTLTGARKFAQLWVGQHPTIGSCYAVSDDGVGKVTVDGCTLRDLFPEPEGDSKWTASGFLTRNPPEPAHPMAPGFSHECIECRAFFARFRCSAASHGECDCPKCQGYCSCA